MESEPTELDEVRCLIFSYLSANGVINQVADWMDAHIREIDFLDLTVAYDSESQEYIATLYVQGGK